MQDLRQNIVSKPLAPYLEGGGLQSAAALLRGVRQALADIKKEQPCLAGLEIAEMSFLKDQKNGLVLKVYFAAEPAALPESP